MKLRMFGGTSLSIRLIFYKVKVSIWIMLSQQISPWTFLKEKLDDDQNNQQEQYKKQGFRLPSLCKRQEGKIKQHTQQIVRKKQRGSPNRQLLMLSQEQRKASFATILMKKNTEPIEVINQLTIQRQMEESWQMRKFIEKRMILRLIYLQLQSEKCQQDKIFHSSPGQLPKTLIPTQQTTPLRTEREKILKSMPLSQKINPNRIHDKPLEQNFSLIRSIIKKIRNSSGKTNSNPFSKKHNIETLKIKLTQNMRNKQ